jgi:Tfp pilus assembly protein PilF
LMKEGMKLVQEQRPAEAYGLFREVTSRDPQNEFAWIWLSLTSQNQGEKRAALERALQINPNSQHAREALRALDAEQTAQATTPTTYGARPNARIGATETSTAPNQGDPLRAALSDDDKGRKAKKPPKAAKTTVVKDQRMISQQPRSRAVAQRIRIAVLFVLAIVATLLIVYFVLQQTRNQNGTQEATNPSPEATTAAATTAAATTAAATEAATPIAVTTAAATTVAASTTSAATTAPATTVAATTAATTTTAVTSPTATTLATTTATTTGTTTLPAGNSEAAQIAKNLQTARDSLAAGDYKSAISAYKAALQVDSSNVAASLGLGQVYMTAPDSALPTGTNRWGEAVQAFKVVTTQAPNWPGGYTLLGQALAGQGDLKAAIAAYSKSLELDPNGPERWLALAAVYDRDNQPEQARFAREKAGNLAATPTPTPTPSPTPAPTPTPKPPAPTPTPKK